MHVRSSRTAVRPGPETGAGTITDVSASRYRCTACGNLTRFDVTTSRKVRAFHHYTVGGELQVEDVEVLSESVDEVACRWCGTGQSVVELSPDDALVSAEDENPS
jgi:hypothetical protein